MKMTVAELKERHTAATETVNALREQLQQRRQLLRDTDVAQYAVAQGKTPVRFEPTDLVCCRTLQGHTGKVYSLDWTPERNRIVSASQDGRLIVWNALTSQKTHAIKLPCAWVMTCAFSPTGQSVASGGLDSVCTIFNLYSPIDKDGNLPVSKTLSGHKGYVSCCQYLPDEDAHLLTSSGDHTCILWDITTGLRTSVFGGEFQSGHTSDVLSVSISGSNSRMFVSGSCDKTARLWDTRVASRAVRTFYGHEGDVNTVKFFPDGNRFGTGSDDGTCRLFDIRTGHQLQVYRPDENDLPQVTSIAFSISGRLLFAGYSSGECRVWDTLLGEAVLNLGSLQNSHEGRISCLGLSADGSALCTGSYDRNLKVYSLDWTPERNRIVSASQDGRLIVWNALTSQKTHAIKLPCAWVMTCAFSPTGQSVASGGLDSVCTIFNLYSPIDKDGNLPVSKTLSGHKGYVSCCQYLPDEDAHLLTSSGDHTCILWDITTGLRTSVFGGEFQSGHTSDVLSVSISGSNSRMFVSGSCDKTARLWDTRVASRAVRTFYGHEGDVNTVKFFPDGNRFGTGSDDGTCRLFDIRTGHQLQVYRPDENDLPQVTSIAFSISGRLLFAGYSSGECRVWDTLLGEAVLNLGSLQNSHEGRISCLGLSADGSALCTGSYDRNLKIWAFGGHRRVI